MVLSPWWLGSLWEKEKKPRYAGRMQCDKRDRDGTGASISQEMPRIASNASSWERGQAQLLSWSFRMSLARSDLDVRLLVSGPGREKISIVWATHLWYFSLAALGNWLSTLAGVPAMPARREVMGHQWATLCLRAGSKGLYKTNDLHEMCRVNSSLLLPFHKSTQCSSGAWEHT